MFSKRSTGSEKKSNITLPEYLSFNALFYAPVGPRDNVELITDAIRHRLT
jgi:hypothetical protein